MPAANRSVTESGLSLLEVILALAVLGILGAVFVTAMLGNLRHTNTAGQRTQSAQVLNFIGRRVAGGDTAVIPMLGDSLTWGYGELGVAFPDIDVDDGFADPERYRATVSAPNTITVTGATIVQYDIEVCFEAQEGESCIQGTTLGAPLNAPPGMSPPLPGIN